MPTDKKDMLRRLNGRAYTGKVQDGFPVGKGVYKNANKMVYTGNFTEGMFHGQGVLTLPEGGKLVGEWNLGKLVKGTYYFQDELEYKEAEWAYCTDADRRFWTEIQKGIKITDEPQLVNNIAPEYIPQNTYDVGDGYYNEAESMIYSYDGKPIRVPTKEEGEWAVSKCRIGSNQVDVDEETFSDRPVDENEGEVDYTGLEDFSVPNNNNSAASNRDQSNAASRFTSRPGSAFSTLSTESTAGFCPASMGGRHVLKADNPLECSLCARVIACPATMGTAHAFDDALGVCTKCNIELDSPSGTKYDRPPTRIGTSKDVRPDTMMSSVSTMSYSACPSSMASPCDWNAQGKCNNCGRSTADITRPPTAAGGAGVINRMVVNDEGAEMSRPGTTMSNMSTASQLSKIVCPAQMGGMCVFEDSGDTIKCAHCGKEP